LLEIVGATMIRPCSPTPIAWTSPGMPRPISPSAMAPGTASAHRWPGSSANCLLPAGFSLHGPEARGRRGGIGRARRRANRGVDRTAGAVMTPVARLRRVRGVKRFGRVLDTPQRFVDSAIYLASAGKEHLGRSIT
jgi:hypothetical protein